MTKTTECRCAAGPNVCKRPGHKREHRAATCDIRSNASEVDPRAPFGPGFWKFFQPSTKVIRPMADKRYITTRSES